MVRLGDKLLKGGRGCFDSLSCQARLSSMERASNCSSKKVSHHSTCNPGGQARLHCLAGLMAAVRREFILKGCVEARRRGLFSLALSPPDYYGINLQSLARLQMCKGLRVSCWNLWCFDDACYYHLIQETNICYIRWLLYVFLSLWSTSINATLQYPRMHILGQ